MSAPLEQELKLALLDPDALPRLLAALPAPEGVWNQDNLYLIEPDAPAERARIMVRVRSEARDREAARHVLTVKAGSRAVDGFFVAEELEAALNEAEVAQIAADPDAVLGLALEPARWLVAVGVRRLEGLGGMRNRRHVIHHAGFVLEVDRTEFPGGVVEAEVEVETERPEVARAVVLAVGGAAGVGLRAQTLGKFTRFRTYQALATRRPG
ncbi:MAG: CYTH domain-containing protein [Myxococcota bacterium]